MVDGHDERDGLFIWSIEEFQEGNRVKASKIRRIYDKMCELYIKRLRRT